LFPVGNVSSDKTAPDLGIFATDLRGVGFDFMKLGWRLKSQQNGSNFPVLKVADII
jgi:hypothetical protein